MNICGHQKVGLNGYGEVGLRFPFVETLFVIEHSGGWVYVVRQELAAL